jgi:hypothetical protein
LVPFPLLTEQMRSRETITIREKAADCERAAQAHDRSPPEIHLCAGCSAMMTPPSWRVEAERIGRVQADLTLADLRIPARTPRINARSAGLLPKRAGIALRDSLVSLSESSFVGGCSVVFEVVALRFDRVQASVMPDLRPTACCMWSSRPRAAREPSLSSIQSWRRVLSKRLSRSPVWRDEHGGDAGPLYRLRR